jgi:hypothetical protein
MSALFRIRPQGAEWVLVEEGQQIGGIFATLVAALEFAAREGHRFQEARTVIELAS